MLAAGFMQKDREGGKEAVCFTSGYKGTAFSAGVIHAYLASDRPAPKIAAGISAGALSAAALERCYRELATGPLETREVRRWQWFRRYLNSITLSPLDVIWKAIPDPVDFFADKAPVSDLSAKSLPQELQDEEQESRENYYRLVKLGLWLAGLRISVADVARCLVMRVRFKERYGYWVWQALRYWLGFIFIISKAFWRLGTSPKFLVERPDWTRRLLSVFRPTKRRLPWPRPLFGWPAWLIAVAVGANASYFVLKLLHIILSDPSSILRNNAGWLAPTLHDFVVSGGWAGNLLLALEWSLNLLNNIAAFKTPLLLWAVLILWAVAGMTVAVVFLTGTPVRYLLGKLGIARGLLHRYTLHRRLFELFRKDENDLNGPVVGHVIAAPGVDFPEGGSMHLLIVAAPLQAIQELQGQQVWAAPGTRVVRALLAALAVPPLFPPVSITEREEIEQWLSKEKIGELPKRLDLIDGSAVRENPLPSLFAWLREHPEVAEELCGEDKDDAGIRLVFNVPVEPYEPDPNKPPPEHMDIVTAAFASMELARRRDSKMECRQTNFLSEMELWVRKAEGIKEKKEADASGTQGGNGASGASSTSHPSSSTSHRSKEDRGYTAFPIFADSIAPDMDIAFGNYLAPERDALLEITAAGCRRSLERLHRNRIRDLGNENAPVACSQLLRQVATARKDSIKYDSPGLSEVCSHCTRELFYPKSGDEAPADVPAEEFTHLSATRKAATTTPRIVFVASGGVFRGAFHIGVIGAMHAAGIRPNLIVGASVGSLMGGALGAISSVESPECQRLLGELCLTFLHVDRRIALTRTLKNAAKQLGIRTRGVDLSPIELRRMVRRGTRSDPGYAVNGAPPALIDAISTIFLIPHAATVQIAAEFVAGHITNATKMFWSSVREETLSQLKIKDALMDTSLLEVAARKLMGFGKHGFRFETTQPYHDPAHPERSISFFGTTSDLNRRRALLLGRDLPVQGSYDFINAGLSSSAFPVVFCPRQEAEVLPGRGRTNVLFSDGGMLDNLPFFPAIEVLSSVQRQLRRKTGETALESLSRRAAFPDLFIAGALESQPPQRSEAPEDMRQIRRRAGALKVNIKLDSFVGTSDLVAAQVHRLIQKSEGEVPPKHAEKFMDEIVPAAVLKIAPTDPDHLNGTFAFCASLGMSGEKISKSIGDGCFQTLRSLVSAKEDKTHPLVHSAVTHLQSEKVGRIRAIAAVQGKEDGSHCPFFHSDGKAFECPFISAANVPRMDEPKSKKELTGIYKACATDPTHRKHGSVY